MAFDLALIDGRIWTEKPAQPEAGSIGIIGNRIAQVGDSREMLRECDARTRVISLDGRRVIPGFNDSHVHFYLGGAALSSVQLRDARNLDEFRERIASFARASPKNEWILLGSWDPELWPQGSLPDRQLIDGLTREHPVFVSRVDAHTSLAMELAGVNRDTADVPGGEIGRRSDGGLTGIFKDAA